MADFVTANSEMVLNPISFPRTNHLIHSVVCFPSKIEYGSKRGIWIAISVTMVSDRQVGMAIDHGADRVSDDVDSASDH